MKKVIIILLFAISLSLLTNAQDSVRAKVIKTAEKAVIYEVKGYGRFISYDCKCDSLKRGDLFMIPKKRFDSLLLEAKPVYKRRVEN